MYVIRESAAQRIVMVPEISQTWGHVGCVLNQFKALIKMWLFFC